MCRAISVSTYDFPVQENKQNSFPKISMKKTLIALTILSAFPSAMADAPLVTKLTYIGDGSSDLMTVNQWEYFSNMKDVLLITRSGKSDATGTPYAYAGNFEHNNQTYNVLTSVSTAGNKDFDLEFSKSSFVVKINEALNFNLIDASKTSTCTWIFGSEGSVTTSSKFDQWGGGIRFAKGASVTFSLTVTDEQLLSVGQDGIFRRDLMISLDETETGIWNVANNLTLDVTGLTNYTSIGLIEDINNLQAGQYGYMVKNPKSDDKFAGDAITFVFKAVPEPTTTTLSLLALAGLAMRRRR